MNQEPVTHQVGRPRPTMSRLMPQDDPRVGPLSTNLAEPSLTSGANDPVVAQVDAVLSDKQQRIAEKGTPFTTGTVGTIADSEKFGKQAAAPAPQPVTYVSDSGHPATVGELGRTGSQKPGYHQPKPARTPRTPGDRVI